MSYKTEMEQFQKALALEERQVRVLKTQIKKAIDVATDLCYPASVRVQLRKAQNEHEITRILLGARQTYL